MADNQKYIEDVALIAAYRSSGDAQYVGTLFMRYRHLCLGVCLKYLKNTTDAEDAVMEIFEKLHLDLKRVDVEHFKSWLYTVARNHCLMRLRKAGLKVEYPEVLPYEAIDWPDTEGGGEKERLLVLLEQYLDALKPLQKQCLTLFFLEDKSYKDIMTETGLGLNDIKSHIQNGKLNLKKMLQKETGTSLSDFQFFVLILVYKSFIINTLS